MKLKQITIAIENSPGRLYEVTKSLGEAGINLRALSLVDTGAFGQLRLLVSDIATTRRLLMKMQMPAKVNEVVAVEVEDKPGSLARMLKPLTDIDESFIKELKCRISDQSLFSDEDHLYKDYKQWISRGIPYGISTVFFGFRI